MESLDDETEDFIASTLMKTLLINSTSAGDLKTGESPFAMPDTKRSLSANKLPSIGISSKLPNAVTANNSANNFDNEPDDVCLKLYGHVSSMFPMLAKLGRRLSACERKCLQLQLQNEQLASKHDLMAKETELAVDKIHVLELENERLVEQLRQEEELNKSLVDLSFRTIGWLDDKSDELQHELQTLMKKQRTPGDDDEEETTTVTEYGGSHKAVSFEDVPTGHGDSKQSTEDGNSVIELQTSEA